MIYPGIKELTKGYIGESDLNSVYLGEELIWPNEYDTIKPVIDQICVDIGYEPIHYALFDGTTDNESIRFGDVLWGASNQFTNTSGVSYGKGLESDRRKALLCNYTNITLHSDARYKMTTQGTISALVKQTSSNSSNTGFLGGVIFGNGHWGLGYGLGWRPNVDNNAPNFEIYTGTGNNDGAATRVWTDFALTINKWYHVMCTFSISGGSAVCNMWINGYYTQQRGSGHNSQIGYQSLNDQTRSEYIHLGLVYQSGTNYWKGLIQDFVMWPTVLPVAQLDKLIMYYRNHGVSN